MKKIVVLLILCVLLTGCSAAETFETLGQIQHQSVDAPVQATVQLSLPESATACVFAGGEERLYDCDGYFLELQTISSGDLQSTLQQLSGYCPEKLTVIESRVGEIKRYDWVWTAAGEDGDMICRAAVLDDGNYHYCLSTMASAQSAGTLMDEWNRLFASFCLV